MFSKTQLDAYKNIKAPDELFDKVMNSKPRKSNLYLLPLAASLVACIVLVFSVAARFNTFSPEITIFGEELSSSVTFYGTSAADAVPARLTPELKVPVTVDAKALTEIQVSCGNLIVDDAVCKDSVSIDSYTQIYWEIPLTENITNCKMTLTSEGKTAVVTLTQDETDGSFTARIN